MIEMQCPACGAEGRIPNEKVDTRLVCKKCLKVFHVSPSGRAILGEPISAIASMSREAPPPDPTVDVDKWLERAWARATSPLSIGLTIVTVLILGLLGYYSTHRPETLEDRATKVARAAIEGDVQAIRALAAAGTEDDVAKWYDTIRPQCDDFKKRLGFHELGVTIHTHERQPEAGTAEIVARIESEEKLTRRGSALPDPSISTTSESIQTVTLPMSWKTEGWSGWRLDGSRTLQSATSSP